MAGQMDKSDRSLNERMSNLEKNQLELGFEIKELKQREPVV